MRQSDRLQKAQAALDEAKKILDEIRPDHTGQLPLRDEYEIARLLQIAETQAAIAQAESAGWEACRRG